MNTQERAFLNGFVKRAGEQGINMDQFIQQIKAQHELNMSQIQGLDATTNNMINATKNMLHTPNAAALKKPNTGILNKLRALLSRKK